MHKGEQMAASGGTPPRMLGIADRPGEHLATDAFIGAFVSLGSLLRRYVRNLSRRQLIVAISVPRRDYVAALIGAGWMVSAPSPALDPPLEVFRRTSPGSCLRAVTEHEVVTGTFTCLNETRSPARVITGGKMVMVDSFRAVSPIASSTENRRSGVPEPGFLGELSGASSSWLERIACPPADLALVGTPKWLLSDLAALVGNGADGQDAGTPLMNYVLPELPTSATWSTPVIASARMREGNPIPPACALVVLDRYGAIKYLDDVTVPIAVCIIDRSVADDSAAELVIQARVSGSTPISLVDELRWRPPTGIEALGFTVEL
jgi:hypothetical protein